MPPADENADRELLQQAAIVCACSNFRKATRAVTQFFDEALAAVGLRSTQLVILLEISLAEKPSIAELAREMVMERSTLTRNLKPLEKRGLVRTTPGNDRRTRVISLTPQGQRALQSAVPHWKKAQTAFVGNLGADRWEQMLQSLGAAVQATRGNSPKK